VGDTKIQIDDAIVEDKGAIRKLMYDKLKEEPKLIVSLRINDDTEFGIVTDIQQELRQAGTLRINYSTKQETPPGAGM
jgi:biopolymer transport protein ExbD